MTPSNSTTAEQVRAYCAQIGTDPLLVQGPGGNVSWKQEGRVLWVKASGKWLAHAESQETFIALDLAQLRSEISRCNFKATPKLISATKLLPSIETFLHALMPHNVVIHLHAVEALSHLVRVDPEPTLKKLIRYGINWGYVNYFKPGAELAAAVADCLLLRPNIEVIFLQNHGVLIGGASVEHVDSILMAILIDLKNPIVARTTTPAPKDKLLTFRSPHYYPCGDNDITELATTKSLSSRLVNEWVLYPDHAVFLGAKAIILSQSPQMEQIDSNGVDEPMFIFDLGNCVYEHRLATAAQRAQLRCYYDVLIRQSTTSRLTPLSSAAVSELIDWDAEKYRKHHS